MRRFDFLFYNTKIFLSGVVLLFIVTPLVIVSLVGGRVNAANEASAGGGSTQNQSVPAYTGGQSVSKVFNSSNGTTNDGSTVTITCTGAVVKQSPGGNAYREGWVDPNKINSLNSASDLNGTGLLSSGSASPYNYDKCPQRQSSTQNNDKDKNKDNNKDKDHQDRNRTQTTQRPQTVNNYYTTNQTQPTTTTMPATNVVYTTAAPAATTQSSPRQLPVTGPAEVLSFGSVTTITAGLTHFFYRRKFGY